MGRECGTYGREQIWLQGFPGELERKRPLLRSGRTWKNKIKTDLQGMEWESVDLINLPQDKDKRRAVANTVMSPQVP